jgi:hypothetical protein
MHHDRVDHLALVVSLFALDNILGGDSSLRKIDVACPKKSISMPKVQPDVNLMLTLLLIDTEHYDDLVATNPDELLDTSNTSSRKLREQDHAVNVVVL